MAGSLTTLPRQGLRKLPAPLLPAALRWLYLQGSHHPYILLPSALLQPIAADRSVLSINFGFISDAQLCQPLGSPLTWQRLTRRSARARAGRGLPRGPYRFLPAATSAEHRGRTKPFLRPKDTFFKAEAKREEAGAPPGLAHHTGQARRSRAFPLTWPTPLHRAGAQRKRPPAIMATALPGFLSAHAQGRFPPLSLSTVVAESRHVSEGACASRQSRACALWAWPFASVRGQSPLSRAPAEPAGLPFFFFLWGDRVLEFGLAGFSQA